MKIKAMLPYKVAFQIRSTLLNTSKYNTFLCQRTVILTITNKFNFRALLAVGSLKYEPHFCLLCISKFCFCGSPS